MTETWKTIEEFPDYQVSDLGRVKSLKYGKERILSASGNSNGYRAVSLAGPGGVFTRKVHRLVLEAFDGPCSVDKPEARHLDGDTQNNVVSNLAWGTRAENEADKRRHGTACGPRPVKLTPLDVRHMREIHIEMEDISKRLLARVFDVSPAQVRAVLSGRAWTQPSHQPRHRELDGRLNADGPVSA